MHVTTVRGWVCVCAYLYVSLCLQVCACGGGGWAGRVMHVSACGYVSVSLYVHVWVCESIPGLGPVERWQSVPGSLPSPAAQASLSGRWLGQDCPLSSGMTFSPSDLHERSSCRTPLLKGLPFPFQGTCPVLGVRHCCLRRLCGTHPPGDWRRHDVPTTLCWCRGCWRLGRWQPEAPGEGQPKAR